MAGLAQSRRWTVLTSDERVERELSERLGVPPLVARVLSARGHVDPAEATAFLEASLDESWEDPLVIPGMSEVADRLDRALDSSETIAVFGDFDVDGMTSTCLLTLALRRLGGDAHPFIPYRFGEGYGLSREALERVVRSCDPDLVVTVDNGIAAANEVDWLLERGIDVVVTDHHEPADLVPVGIPVTDPKLSANCPSHELAGAGVALKLVCELGRRRGIPDLWRSYTDVAALGTLSDMMLQAAAPLTGHYGIELEDVIIRQIRYSDDLTESVYARMIKERSQIAEAYRSYGRGQLLSWQGRTQNDKMTILSGAYAESERIKGEADSEAAAIYRSSYGADPEFFRLWTTLESYRRTMPGLDKTLTTDAEYFDYIYSPSGT